MPINRRDVLKAGGAVVSGLARSGRAADAKNVIVVGAGIAGLSCAYELSRRGTPSRQSFFTGQMPHSAGVSVLNSSLSPDKPTVAKQFKAAGYRTAVFWQDALQPAGGPWSLWL